MCFHRLPSWVRGRWQRTTSSWRCWMAWRLQASCQREGLLTEPLTCLMTWVCQRTAPLYVLWKCLLFFLIYKSKLCPKHYCPNSEFLLQSHDVNEKVTVRMTRNDNDMCPKSPFTAHYSVNYSVYCYIGQWSSQCFKLLNWCRLDHNPNLMRILLLIVLWQKIYRN